MFSWSLWLSYNFLNFSLFWLCWMPNIYTIAYGPEGFSGGTSAYRFYKFMGSVIAETNPVIQYNIQGCQTYRTLCLWERFFPLLDLILKGQFKGQVFLKISNFSSQKCLISLTSSLLREIEWLENCPISMKSKIRKISLTSKVLLNQSQSDFEI